MSDPAALKILRNNSELGLNRFWYIMGGNHVVETVEARHLPCGLKSQVHYACEHFKPTALIEH